MNQIAAMRAGEPVEWIPTEDQIRATNLTAFLKFAKLPDFDELLKASNSDPARFWEMVIQYSGLRFYRPYERIMDTSAGIERVKWCVGGVTNLVLNCVDRYRDSERYHQPYMTWEGENRQVRSLTLAEFDHEVCKFASVLRQIGIGRGDVVALYMPQLIETYVAYFSVVKIGAIVLPLFSGYGPGAIAERLQLTNAKAVVTVDGANRRGTMVPMKAVVDEARSLASSVQHVIVVERVGRDTVSHGQGDLWWGDLVPNGNPYEKTEEMPANAIAVVHFTSGTTGRPKGAMYTHIGFVTKMVLDYGIIGDFKPSDTYLCLADMGWMVGSQIAVIPSVLGGKVVIAEGVGDYPSKDRLWQLVDDHSATWLMVTPSFMRMQMKEPNEAIGQHSLRSLRVVFGSGEPWMEAEWRWLFDSVCHRIVPILNGTGGTEISGCILLSNLHRPIKACSFNAAVPGMGADVARPDGTSAPPGEIGELAMRQASIGLTPGLWGNDDRYLETYWHQVPGVWIQGDLASRDDDGHFYLYGRSDDTMKIAGRRVGPAEIEGAALSSGLVVEAAAVAIPDPIKGSSLVLIAVPIEEAESEKTKQAVAAHIVALLGAPYRPQWVLLVPALPKTGSMKIMRRLIRSALSGELASDVSALANPDSLNAIRHLVDSGALLSARC
jgi:acetyl-CoA synthetase